MRPVYSSIMASALLLSACDGDRTRIAGNTGTAAPDTTVVDTAAQAVDTVMPPAAADGLFDDFVYSFMHNKHFQLQRIKFPLHNTIDGHDTPIDKTRWRHDPLYVHKDTYTILFDNERSMRNEKDTSIHHVTVEWIYLDKGRVKQYHFSKEHGKWMLTAIDSHALAQNANSDFFKFYHRFSTEPSYQLAHIDNPFKFKTYDSDTFQEIDGVLDAAQWPDFRPAMPAHVITNIDYGQRYAPDGRRVLVITSPSDGMSCTLSFQKRRGTWKLTGMKSI